jgi:hypothetical protein
MIDATAAGGPNVDVEAGYRKAVRFGGLWSMIISPYLILYFGLIIALGQANNATVSQELEFAGRNPFGFGINVFLDGFFHVLFFVTVTALFIVLRKRWPVMAALILVFGAWQMFIGFTKALNSFIALTTLGNAYLGADPTQRIALQSAAMGVDGLRMALQWMDSLGVMMVWILVSLLPAAAGIPRVVRWLGWVMAAAILSPDPAFLLVVLLSPVWLFFLGRWLRRLALGSASAVPVPRAEGSQA